MSRISILKKDSGQVVIRCGNNPGSEVRPPATAVMLKRPADTCVELWIGGRHCCTENMQDVEVNGQTLTPENWDELTDGINVSRGGWGGGFNLNPSGAGEGRTYLRLFTADIPLPDGSIGNLMVDLMLTGKEVIPGGRQSVFTRYILTGIIYRTGENEFHMDFKCVAHVPANAGRRYGRVFIRRETPGSNRLEAWASMDSGLSGTCSVSGNATCTVTNDAQTDVEPEGILLEIEPVEII